MKSSNFEKALALVIVTTGLIVIEKKLEEVAFKGLDSLFKDSKPKPTERGEPKE